MKKLLLAGVALTLLLAGSALAADLSRPVYTKAPPPAPPPAAWTGFYIGVVGGGGWATSNHTDALVAANTTGDFSQSGGFAGGTLGYNWRFNQWVFGLEGDLAWADINGSVTTSTGAPTTFTTTIRGVDTARARAGYLITPDLLLYLTGGAAFVNVKACAVGVVCGTDNRVGGTVGAGGEWMFAPHWSAKLEYLFTTFDTKQSYIFTDPINVTEKDVSLVRAGINLHF